jgi:uncharacterized protein YwgA
MQQEARLRTQPQEIWDRIILLHLLQAAHGHAGVDNLKIQKLMFIAEIEGARRNLRAAHYPFFRHTHGPFSKELANEVVLLERLGLIDPESRELTDRAAPILQRASHDMDRSAKATEVLSIVNGVCADCKHLDSFPHLVNHVLDMVVPVAGWGNEPAAIRDVPLCVDILRPNDLHAMDVLPFDADLLGELEDAFSATADQHGLGSEMAHYSICDTD